MKAATLVLHTAGGRDLYLEEEARFINDMKKIVEWDREHPARFLSTALLIPDKDIPKLEDYLLKHNFDMNRCLELLLEDHASVDEASVSKLRF